MSDISHEEVLVISLPVISIVTGGLGYYVNRVTESLSDKISEFTEVFMNDHVHRAEFTSVVENVNMLREQLAVLKDRLERHEGRDRASSTH